jgi:hypothetical protein
MVLLINKSSGLKAYQATVNMTTPRARKILRLFIEQTSDFLISILETALFPSSPAIRLADSGKACRLDDRGREKDASNLKGLGRGKVGQEVTEGLFPRGNGLFWSGGYGLRHMLAAAGPLQWHILSTARSSRRNDLATLAAGRETVPMVAIRSRHWRFS